MGSVSSLQFLPLLQCSNIYRRATPSFSSSSSSSCCCSSSSSNSCSSTLLSSASASASASFNINKIGYSGVLLSATTTTTTTKIKRKSLQSMCFQKNHQSQLMMNCSTTTTTTTPSVNINNINEDDDNSSRTQQLVADHHHFMTNKKMMIRRETLFQLAFAAVAAISSPSVLLVSSSSSSIALAEEETTDAKEDFRIYSDEKNKFNIMIPQDWQVGTGPGNGIKSLTAFYPPVASQSNVSVLITGLGADFTRLESFGKVDEFAETLVSGLDRSWQRPPGVKAKLINSKASKGFYYIEYSLQNPGESCRHIFTSLGIASNTWYNRLYTVTGQFLEEDAEKYGSKIQKVRPDREKTVAVRIPEVRNFVRIQALR